jgi:hypothetical protein
VGCKKDTCHHKTNASVENAHSATPFGISRFVFGRAFKVEWLAHCRLSPRETLGYKFWRNRAATRQGGNPIVAVVLFGSTVIA